MKILQKLSAAALLTMILALSAFADDGQMGCPVGTQPLPPPASATAEGQINCPTVAQSLMLTLETVFLLA